MSHTAKVVYTAKTTTTGGRDSGASRSSDGLLDIRLSTPSSARIGTNPEQLLAAGWSASFISAIVQVARTRKIALLPGVSIAAEVDLNLGNDGCYLLSVRLTVNLPGLDRKTAEGLVSEAHKSCPYSRATHANIGVEINLA